MDPFLGEIRMFAGNFPPRDWAFCDGQLLEISQNDALFALIGTIYGGDGQRTFALPDLRGRIPLHQGQNPKSGTTFNLGQISGTETETLTTQQIPVHNHVVNATSETGTQNSPEGAIWAANVQEFSTEQPDVVMNGSLISNVGGNQPHDNMMPFLPVSFIISLNGIFPPRD